MAMIKIYDRTFGHLYGASNLEVSVDEATKLIEGWREGVPGYGLDYYIGEKSVIEVNKEKITCERCLKMLERRG